MSKTAIIIGAGPAGLTAAYELLKKTDITPIILEKSGDIGGISKTINYKGNRMDIGGHRFFSKSDRVMNWWMNIMPVQPAKDTYTTITYQKNHRTIKQEETPTPEKVVDESKMMLIRRRLSRIYFLRKFFTYPIQLSFDTLNKLGPIRTLGILGSYIKAQLFPRKPEKSLEDFLINRFGRKLYLLFFKDYTEKVWGVPCNEISAEWGAQRIKGVSISKAIQHAAQTIIKKKNRNDIAQKDTETSLIEQFMYPALGPGQLWEEVAHKIEVLGGKIIMHESVKEILIADNQVTGVITENDVTGEQTEYTGDYFFSTMPVQELIAGMNGEVPTDVKEIAAGLQYRDFITIGVLLKKLTPPDNKKMLPDTWIYIQEKDVKVGRLQIFNNWSPYMVKDPDTVWLGMEYFCNKGDEFWNLSDADIQRTAISELEKMGLANVEDVLDSTVQRMEKTYPAYFGTYNQFDKIREFTDQFENLFLVGRNGMHKYNNSDHSMLTAMVSVDNICEGITTKANIWEINTEQEYHEEKKEADAEIKESVYNKPQNKKSEPEMALTFKEFLFRNTFNRRILWFSVIAVVIQFVIFKYFYPFASYIHGDSFVYIRAAANNEDINTHLIGYSRFLRLFSVFSSSDTVLVAFQYLLAQASGVFFLFTLFYFHNIGKTIQIVLLGFMVINPMFIYMANMVSTDCIFLSLSLTWFSILLWLVNRPSNRLIFWHSVVLFLAFTIRYNALVYPMIATLAFLFSGLPWHKRIVGIMAPVILCGFFIFYTGNKYKKLTGTWQFSPFSGWQAANNALYTYRYVDSADRKPVPEKFKALDTLVREYFDTHRDLDQYPYEAIKAGTGYMWSPGLPLNIYRNRVLKGTKDTSASDIKKWALMGPFFKEYGTYILKQYPLQYAEHFMWPNFIKYYAPPAEFLGFYNDAKDSVSPIAKSWFHYPSTKVYSRIKDPKAYLLDIYPILTGIMNVVLLCCLACYTWLKGWRSQRHFRKTLALVTAIWLINAAFTIVASPAAIRLQAFPLLLETTFALILVDWLWKLASNTELAGSLKAGLAPAQEESNSALA
jgi:protoporphyrinogen oxidase